MATLWLLADVNDELVSLASVGQDDIVRRLGGGAPVLLPQSDGVVVMAGSMRGLLSSRAALDAMSPVTHFEIFVAGPPSAVPVGIPTDGLRAASPRTISLTTQRTPVAHTHLQLRTGRPVSPGGLLASVTRRIPSPIASASSTGDPGPLCENRSTLGWNELATLPRAAIERAVTSTDVAGKVPTVDITTLTPTGLFRGWDDHSPDKVAHVLWNTRSAGWDVVDQDREILTHIPGWLGLTEANVSELRGLRKIRLQTGATAGPQETATLIVEAAIAAVPVVPEHLDSLTATLLGPAVTQDLRRYADIDASDDVAFEGWLMDIRRSAFTDHGDRSRARQRAGPEHRTSAKEPSVTVLLATMRAGLLPWALDQLDRQSWSSFDVVIGLHGSSAELPLVKSAVAKFSRPITIIEISRSHNLGEALRIMTEHAEGEFIAKVDDDDWYGEHHLTDLMQAHMFSGATVVGSGAEFIYLAELDMTIRRQSRSGHVYTRFIAGSTFLLARDDLRGLNGWRPVPRAVDTALMNAVLSAGGSAYRTHGLGFVVYRGATGHTWNEGPPYFLRRRPPQWRGFDPPPRIVGAPPAVEGGVHSWFDRPTALPEYGT